ncbi:hypothetical protein AGDE_05974 [Angomonas deanei]|nr:hypothetical protein AGDE_05974 [Angomonas deanei]|eukprot:EPY37959.1 hypothetical protein AGDE_05974 [Angomonas deanei]
MSVRAVLLFACLWCLAASARDLVSLKEIFPNKSGNTKVSFSVISDRVRIPLQDGKKDLFFEYSGRFYSLGNGPLLPGPVLHVVPGRKLVIEIKNELGKFQNMVNKSAMFYSIHGFNITNIHFHGLHSKPSVDDPFAQILPGESKLYKLGIVRDQMPGIHWYHAHSHGSVYAQVMGGLFGAISVGESALMNAPEHPFRNWDATHLMIHLYRLNTSTRCDGRTMHELDALNPSGLTFDAKIVDSDGNEKELPSDLFLVNGQHRPTVDVVKSSPHIFRMTFAAGSCFVNMTLPSISVTFHIIGYDGVQFKKTRPLQSSWLYFTTATRVGLVVVCHEEGVFPVSHSDDDKDVLFYVESTSWNKNREAQVTFPVLLPKYSPDYLYLGGKRKVQRDISFWQEELRSNHNGTTPYYIIGQGKDCSSLKNSSTCFYDHFQGQLGNNPDAYHGFTVPLHSVVTARIYGDADPMPHPFHLHANHFQYLSFVPRVGGFHENVTMEMYGVFKGQYRDTIPILDGVTTVRWQAATFSGEIVYHCHALHHEDMGMMTSYLVQKRVSTPPKETVQYARHKISNAKLAGIFLML